MAYDVEPLAESEARDAAEAQSLHTIAS